MDLHDRPDDPLHIFGVTHRVERVDRQVLERVANPRLGRDSQDDTPIVEGDRIKTPGPGGCVVRVMANDRNRPRRERDRAPPDPHRGALFCGDPFIVLDFEPEGDMPNGLKVHRLVAPRGDILILDPHLVGTRRVVDGHGVPDYIRRQI